MADLRVKFAGVEFKNPIVASAGHITHSPYTMKRCIEAGVGAICTKSISVDAESWKRPHPANWFLDKQGDPGSVLTCEVGFWPPELAVQYIQEMRPLADEENVRLIANIDVPPFTEDELAGVARRLEEAGADMIEATCPCPIMMPSREDVNAWYREQVSRFLKALKRAVSIPVFPKMSSEFLTDENIKIIEDSGADAHCFWVGLPGTAVDVETGRPVMPSTSLYFGRALKGLGCYMSSMLAIKGNLPIMSSGGISTWRDAVESLMCGTTLVGVQTAVMYRGYKVLVDMTRGLGSFMDSKGYRRVDDIIGIAARHIENSAEFEQFVSQKQVDREAVMITVDPVLCNGCGRCLTCCHGAITMEEGLARIDLERCERCGICQSICPVRAIAIGAIEEVRR
ncbi:MAG: 4Fe-4S binding protein [Chloroflexi bacterium]|nr:4Fe-4S binding protein [Chloroflexota bacterium]